MSHQKLTMMRSTMAGNKRFCGSSTSPSTEIIASMKSKPSLLLQRQISAQSEESFKNINEFTPGELTLENKSAILRSQIKNGQANLMKGSQSVENFHAQSNKKKLLPSRSTQQVSPIIIIPTTRGRPQSSLPQLEDQCFNSSNVTY